MRNVKAFLGFRFFAARVALIYAVFGLVWVFFFDIAFFNVAGSVPADDRFSFYKELLYVVLSSGLVFLLILRSLRTIARSDERQRILFNNMNEAVFVHEGAGADGLPGLIIEVNDAACRRLGYAREELLRMRPGDIDDPATRGQAPFMMSRLQALGDSTWEGVHLTKSGEQIPVEISARIFELEGRDAVLAIARDLTQRIRSEQELAKERNLLRTLIDNIPDSVYVKDTAGRKILTNRADLEFMGVDEEKDALGRLDADIYPKHLADMYARDDHSVLVGGRAVINREEINEDAEGNRRWLLTSKLPLRGPDGTMMGLVGIGRDITDRKILESKLVTMAHFDALTLLPNRIFFIEKANMALAQAKRAGTQCAIIFVDLDHFKSINDTLGHSVGDELLKDTAAKLSDCIRETDVMARLGGDEFIILLSDLKDSEEAQRIAEAIGERMNVPRLVSGNDLFVTTSIGIATFPNDGENLEELLKNADTAMYAAKDAGRNSFCFFNQAMNLKAVTRMQVERGLRHALARNELSLYYQPIVNVADGRIRGFEALLRWLKTDGGLVLPGDFIAVAEETGLIIPIGEWVLRQACRFNRRLIDEGAHADMIISVNVSVAQLRRKNIIDVIRGALEASELPAANLEIEVTESLFIDSFEQAMATLESIRALGVHISLDDFGTGYSSFVHLQKLPIDTLKIDRVFISGAGADGVESSLIPAMVGLAHKLKLRVVAEGVETGPQLERLAENGCDYFQGYFLSRPMPEDRVAAFLAARASV